VPAHSAPKGTLYINTTAATSSNRLFINANNSTAWDSVISGSGSIAASPQYAIQYNDPLGTFAGSSDLTWASTSGLLNKKHASFGSDGAVETRFSMSVLDTISGDLDYLTLGGGPAEGLRVIASYVNTGVGAIGAALRGADVTAIVLPASTGKIVEMTNYFECISQGSGNVSTIIGLEGKASHYGTGTCGGLIGVGAACNIYDSDPGNPGAVTHIVEFESEGSNVQGVTVGERDGMLIYQWYPTNGGMVNNNYGLRVRDQSGVVPFTGVADTTCYNILSENYNYAGTLAHVGNGNLFQGHCAIGNFADVDFGTAPSALTIYEQFSGTHTDANLLLIKSHALAGGAAITNLHGIKIEDQSGLGSAISDNIRSLGAASRNHFAGTINFGTANNTPQNGDVWFDGTDLKLRTGGVTKTFTVT